LAGDIKAGARNRPGFFLAEPPDAQHPRSIRYKLLGRLARRRIAWLAVGELDGRAVAHPKPHAFPGAVAEELDPGLFKPLLAWLRSPRRSV
jgi:hypothetical protein